MFVLTIVVVRQKFIADSRLAFLQYLEYKSQAEVFPSGRSTKATEDFLKVIFRTLLDKKGSDESPKNDIHGKIENIFKYKSSRAWLIYTILILGIIMAMSALYEIYIYIEKLPESIGSKGHIAAFTPFYLIEDNLHLNFNSLFRSYL